MSRSRPHSVPGERELLCEGCGYRLAADGSVHVRAGSAGPGTAPGPTARCPECGLRVEESLPHHRDGTAWQRSRGLAAWVLTGAAVFTAPRALFRRARPERDSARSLRLINCAVAATLIALAWTPIWVEQGLRVVHGPDAARAYSPALTAAWTLTGVGALTLLLLTLCRIEIWGVRFFGRLREWRVTPAVAETAIALSSYGWIVGAAVLAVPAWWPSLLQGGPRWRDVPVLGELVPTGASVLPAAAGVLAVVVFETLVYVGVRRMRYANRPEAVLPRSAPDGALS